MLIQSLVVIATMLVLAGAILTSSLVTAKATLHQAMLTKSQVAMNDAISSFVTETQRLVKNYGTAYPVWPLAAPVSEPLCTSAGGLESSSHCGYTATMSWRITGSSAGGVAAKVVSTGAANAAYLASSVGEQRISATISVQVSNDAGTRVFSERSREITARIFTAEPYVVVTGTRDISAQAGSIRASEGDTAGAPAVYDRSNNAFQSPQSDVPAGYTDTRILTSIDCSNSVATSTAPIGDAYFDPKIHPYGNLAWHNESSCTSGLEVSVGLPIGYAPPAGSLYVAQPSNPNEAWNKNDEGAGEFAR